MVSPHSSEESSDPHPARRTIARCCRYVVSLTHLTRRWNQFIARLLARILRKGPINWRLTVQKPQVEPLDAFVASVSDEDLGRQLIMDSKFHPKSPKSEIPRYAGDLPADLWSHKPRAVQSHHWSLHSSSKSRFSPVRSLFFTSNAPSGDIRVVKAVECDDLLHLVFFYHYLTDLSTMSWFFLPMETGIWPGLVFFCGR